MKGRRQPHLMLYGQIAWQVGSRVEPVSSGRAASLLATLASYQPTWTPATQFIDELWESWPHSGANAVQRHISHLRSHLRQIGVADQVIETSSNGYRLAPWVSTDLRSIEENLKNGEIRAGDSSLGPNPHWWAEPLPGLSWDHHRTLRGTLTFCANQARKLWVADAIDSNRTAEAARLLGPMLVRDPYDTELVHLVADIAMASTDRELGRTLRIALVAAIEQSETQDESLHERVLQLKQIRSPPVAVGYQKLDSVANGWLHNDLDQSFESIDGLAGDFAPDVIRRVARCLTWISSENPWARLMWSEMVGLPPAMAELAERSLVSLDAFALEHNKDALQICDQEVAEASGILEQVRALRVRFMVGLGHPISSQQIETVDRLATINDPMANVEALRFSGILAVKLGEVDQAQILFERSVDLQRKTQAAIFDDFARMAALVISMAEGSFKGQEQAVPSALPALFPLVSTHATVEMVTLWRLLTTNQPSGPAGADGMLQRVLTATPPECCRAYSLLFDLRADKASSVAAGETADDARSLFQSIRGLPSNRHRQATLFALSRFAITQYDSEMARELHHLLLPWSGEQLGIWPLDVLIGPTDALLHQLENVFDS